MTNIDILNKKIKPTLCKDGTLQNSRYVYNKSTGKPLFFSACLGRGGASKQKVEKDETRKEIEQNKDLEIEQEVLYTIAKKDFSKRKSIQNTAYVQSSDMLFTIKKDDPITVIKTTQKGTLRDNVFYSLKKHNGKTFKMPESLGVFSEYNLPKDVVEESVLIEKIPSKFNTLGKGAYLIIGAVLVAGYFAYKKIKK